MKIWRLSYNDSAMGRLVSWHPSKAEAARALARDRRDYRQAAKESPDNPNVAAMDGEEIQQWDVPTDKAGLIKWLNSWVNTDNG